MLCAEGAVGGLAVAGSAPGMRGMDALKPWHMAPAVHAVVFCGGSSLGLGAVEGVARWLARKGVGMEIEGVRVPLVGGAVIFDLTLTRAKALPDAALGEQACEAAGPGPMARGSVGAGAGASVGKLFGLKRACRGGVGGASLRTGRLVVGAMVVVNAFGDVVDEHGRIIAGARTGEDSTEFADTEQWYLAGGIRKPGQPASTTLAVVATNARLTKLEATKVAALAHHGLVRAIRPVHTLMDGDLVCVLARGEEQGDINGLGVMAARVVEVAIRDAVLSAAGLPGLPAAVQLRG